MKRIFNTLDLKEISNWCEIQKLRSTSVLPEVWRFLTSSFGYMFAERCLHSRWKYLCRHLGMTQKNSSVMTYINKATLHRLPVCRKNFISVLRSIRRKPWSNTIASRSHYKRKSVRANKDILDWAAKDKRLQLAINETDLWIYAHINGSSDLLLTKRLDSMNHLEEFNRLAHVVYKALHIFFISLTIDGDTFNELTTPRQIRFTG